MDQEVDHTKNLEPGPLSVAVTAHAYPLCCLHSNGINIPASYPQPEVLAGFPILSIVKSCVVLGLASETV